VRLDIGWFTTIPLPKQSTAEAFADKLADEFSEVMVERVESGYVVKYRGRRETGETGES
jgi:hypothetical protein